MYYTEKKNRDSIKANITSTLLFEPTVVEEVTVFYVTVDDLTLMYMRHSTQQRLHVFTNFTHRHVTYIILFIHTETDDTDYYYYYFFGPLVLHSQGRKN